MDTAMRSFVRTFFLSNPKRTVDDCARELERLKFGVPFSKHEISQIRLRTRNDSYLSRNDPVIPSKIPPLKPLHELKPIWEKSKVEKGQERGEERREEPKPLTVEVPSPTKKNKLTKAQLIETTKEKKRFLNELIEKMSPEELKSMTSPKLVKLIKEKYGTGLDFVYVGETIRVAKELQGLGRPKNSNKKSDGKLEVRKKKTDPKEVLVSWSDGSAKFEVLQFEDVKKFVISLMVKHDANIVQTIRVWKEVPFQANINFDIG